MGITTTTPNLIAPSLPPPARRADQPPRLLPERCSPPASVDRLEDELSIGRSGPMGHIEIQRLGERFHFRREDFNSCHAEFRPLASHRGHQ